MKTKFHLNQAVYCWGRLFDVTMKHRQIFYIVEVSLEDGLPVYKISLSHKGYPLRTYYAETELRRVRVENPKQKAKRQGRAYY
jgi:hypothetical protein